MWDIYKFRMEYRVNLLIELDYLLSCVCHDKSKYSI